MQGARLGSLSALWDSTYITERSFIYGSYSVEFAQEHRILLISIYALALACLLFCMYCVNILDLPDRLEWVRKPFKIVILLMGITVLYVLYYLIN